MTKAPTPPFVVSARARTRLLAAIERAQPPTYGLIGALSTQVLMGAPADLYTAAGVLIKGAFGIDLDETPHRSIADLCRDAGEDLLMIFLCGCYAALRRWEGGGNLSMVSSAAFENQVNEILKNDNVPVRLQQSRLVRLGESDAEVLRRTLLADPADVATCQQGDVQVEMVVSSIQARLANPGAVLVDYGVGLGRVLGGLASAKRFADVIYVAVDEPIPPEVRQLAGRIGANASFRSRREFLENPAGADVILMVNVLHHIPFRELPRQMSVLLSAVKPSGLLVIHEICELRDPEQRNVPWRIEDILRLLQVDSLDVNPRTTITKGKRVPLANVLVARKSDDDNVPEALTANARAVWARMKQRTLEEIEQLYSSGDQERHVELQHLLITNANLDLNVPE